MTHAGATSSIVITGHSRLKDGVASLAYDPVIHHLLKKMDGRVEPGHDEL